MKYDTGSPDTGAFSGRPLPWARWQRLQAKTCAASRPLATISGIGGCALGNQSAGPKRLYICDRVNDPVEPGVVLATSGAARPAGGAAGSGGPAGGWRGSIAIRPQRHAVSRSQNADRDDETQHQHENETVHGQPP